MGNANGEEKEVCIQLIRPPKYFKMKYLSNQQCYIPIRIEPALFVLKNIKKEMISVGQEMKIVLMPFIWTARLAICRILMRVFFAKTNFWQEALRTQKPQVTNRMANNTVIIELRGYFLDICISYLR